MASTLANDTVSRLYGSDGVLSGNDTIIISKNGTVDLSGLKLTPAEYMQAVEKATATDIAKAAKTLQLHTVYFLRGAV